MGKRLAVLVGCNYPSTQFMLHGCINDVVAMRDVLLQRFGFDSSHVELLTDVPVPGSLILPTGANIKAALNRMVDKAEAGDVLFFHFSGHGTTISSLEPGQPFRQDEAIVPCDLNVITDMDLRQLIRRLPKGSSFTILSDSCHSGGLIDKEKEQIGHSTLEKIIPTVYHRPKSISSKTIHQCLKSVWPEPNPDIGSLMSGIFGKDVSLKFLPQLERDLFKSLDENEGILLSGCEANETSADVVWSNSSGGKAYGAFTSAVRQVLAENSGALSNRQVVMMSRKVLKEHGFQQHACLYSSDGNAGANFLGSQQPSPTPKEQFFFSKYTGVATDEAVKN
ncbi:hypothetical protein CRYUN_Cryun01aG0086100 [Craigia yunnanensis]